MTIYLTSIAFDTNDTHLTLTVSVGVALGRLRAFHVTFTWHAFSSLWISEVIRGTFLNL